MTFIVTYVSVCGICMSKCMYKGWTVFSLALAIMDCLGRVRRAYLLAMALQHVDQIHLNNHQHLQGIRRRRRCQRRRLWQRLWVSRRRQFGLYDQLLVELSQEDQSSFKNFMRMPVEMYDEILRRIQDRISKQYSWYR